MSYAAAIAKLEEIDAKLVREGDPDLRDLPITDGQRKWLLHLGLRRALEVLHEAAPLDLGPLCPSCGSDPDVDCICKAR